MTSILEQTVERWMTKDVLTVKTDQTVAELLDLLEQHGIHGAPVVDEENHVLGVVSMTDVVMTEVDNLRQPAFYFTAALSPIRKSSVEDIVHRQIGDIMTRQVFTTTAGASLKEASKTLVKHGVQRLVVTDDNSQLVGVLSVTDILLAITSD